MTRGRATAWCISLVNIASWVGVGERKLAANWVECVKYVAVFLAIAI